MGLDQFIFKVSKANLENRTFTSDEIENMYLNKIEVSDFEKYKDMYKALIPYTEKRNVECKLYDTAKIFSDYKLPANSYIWCYSPTGITIGYVKANGERANQEVSNAEIEAKYIKTEVIPFYIFKSEEVYYWRKEYDLCDWIENALKKQIENCGYYKLNKTVIKRMNSKFKSEVPVESANKEYAYFYHEWY